MSWSPGLDAAFWEASLPGLEFTFVAGAVHDLLGGDTESWPDEARTWGSHIDERDREEAMAGLQRAIESGVGEALEYRVPSDDGSPRWIRDLIHVIRGRGGAPTILRGLMVDITERKRAERALRASERKYSDAFKREREAAQRLRMLDEMKNTFLEAVSHDLRTPLTSILGLGAHARAIEARPARRTTRSTWWEGSPPTPGSSSDCSPTCSTSIVSSAGSSRRSDARPTWRTSSGEPSQEMDTQGRRIELDVQPGSVQIDQAKTERILENLLSNSLRHTPEDAKIWVRARPHDDGVLFIVEDDGPGVPPELREAIFEPFRQAPGSSSVHAPGVGIGLSLVRRFAELHGGNAWAEEREGGGASFHVFLPGS